MRAEMSDTPWCLEITRALKILIIAACRNLWVWKNLLLPHSGYLCRPLPPCYWNFAIYSLPKPLLAVSFGALPYFYCILQNIFLPHAACPLLFAARCKVLWRFTPGAGIPRKVKFWDPLSHWKKRGQGGSALPRQLYGHRVAPILGMFASLR